MTAGAALAAIALAETITGRGAPPEERTVSLTPDGWTMIFDAFDQARSQLEQLEQLREIWHRRAGTFEQLAETLPAMKIHFQSSADLRAFDDALLALLAPE